MIMVYNYHTEIHRYNLHINELCMGLIVTHASFSTILGSSSSSFESVVSYIPELGATEWPTRL